MKRCFALTLNTRDPDRRASVLDKIGRLDPDSTADPERAPYLVWVATNLTREQLVEIPWVVDAVLSTKEVIKNRRFHVIFPNKMSHASRYSIVAMQEWVNRDTWEHGWFAAEDWDLGMKWERRRTSDPVGDIKYDLWLLIGYPARSKNHHIGRYESLKAALDTLFDMGIIDEADRGKTLRMKKDGSPGGEFK